MIQGKSFVRAVIRTKNVNETQSAVLALASPAQRKIANESGALAALDAIRAYYASRGRNMWVNLSLPTHGPGRKVTQWWRSVANGWDSRTVTGTRAMFENATVGLAHKITGGTIRAKRAKFLTIPVAPEAHGLTAKTFSRTIAPLFRVKNILAMTDDDGGIKPVFVLKRAVTQGPWRGALPPEASYTGPFIDAALDSLERQFLAQ